MKAIPLYTNDGYNIAAIMKMAQALAGAENKVLIERVGYRQVLAWNLARAWKWAKSEKADVEYIAPVLTNETADQITDLKS